MNIAYLVYRFPCISEPFVMDQITGMLDRKHHVRIYAQAGPTGDPVHPQVAAYGLLARTRYLPRTASTRVGLAKQAAKAVLAKPSLLARPGIARDESVADRIRTLARLHGFVWPRVPRFDIVHCQFGCIARSHWAAKSIWGSKLVVSFRGHDFSILPRLFGPGMYRQLFHEADAIMAVCDYAADRLIELGCPAEKLVTHYSGTDLEDFEFRERTRAPGEPVRILSVARLEESKGLEFALRAVARLIRDHRLDVRYGIAGGGSLRKELEGLADALGIAGRVTFFGPQSRPAVRDLMARHDLFLLPSTTTADGGQEGIPGTVREAMATGMPVVSTWHSGIPELVADGVSGFLVPERDVDALTGRLRELVLDPQRWPGMGRCGREQVERRFDIRHLNRRLEAFYRHVLAGGVPAEFAFADPDPALEERERLLTGCNT